MRNFEEQGARRFEKRAWGKRNTARIYLCAKLRTGLGVDRAGTSANPTQIRLTDVGSMC